MPTGSILEDELTFPPSVNGKCIVEVVGTIPDLYNLNTMWVTVCVQGTI